MIWFCVCFCLLFWWLGVEVVGGDGCGSGCGRWQLVAVGVGSSRGWVLQWISMGSGSGCGRWWLVAVSWVGFCNGFCSGFQFVS